MTTQSATLPTTKIDDDTYVDCIDGRASGAHLQVRIEGDNVVLLPSEQTLGTKLTLSEIFGLMLDGREAEIAVALRYDDYLICPHGGSNIKVTGDQLDLFVRYGPQAFVQAMHISGHSIPITESNSSGDTTDPMSVSEMIGELANLQTHDPAVHTS